MRGTTSIAKLCKVSETSARVVITVEVAVASFVIHVRSIMILAPVESSPTESVKDIMCQIDIKGL